MNTGHRAKLQSRFYFKKTTAVGKEPARQSQAGHGARSAPGSTQGGEGQFLPAGGIADGKKRTQVFPKWFFFKNL